MIFLKAVIFDLDGTLLNSIGDLATAVNFALEKNGLSALPLETVKGYVGNGAGLLIERSSKMKRGSPEFKKCYEDFLSYYKEHMAVLTKPYEGICEVLSRLKSREIKTGILSNKPDMAVKPLSEHYFKNLIDFALGEKEGSPGKPDPAGVFEVMKELKSGKADTLYVGDSEVDILTGRNAGLKTLSCLWGFKTREFLIEKGAETLIEKPSEILEFL